MEVTSCTLSQGSGYCRTCSAARDSVNMTTVALQAALGMLEGLEDGHHLRLEGVEQWSDVLHDSAAPVVPLSESTAASE